MGLLAAFSVRYKGCSWLTLSFSMPPLGLVQMFDNLELGPTILRLFDGW